MGPLSAGTWKSFNAQEMSEIYFSRHIDQTANLLADTIKFLKELKSILKEFKSISVFYILLLVISF